MAKPWREVIASPQYQALPPEQQAAAQQQYFSEVVAPQAGSQAEQARQAFYSAYPLPAQADSAGDEGFLNQAAMGVAEAGRAAAQAGVNIGNIVPTVADALTSAGTWAGEKLGLGDGTYNPAPRLELPESWQPKTTAGQVAAEAIPYFANPAAAAGRAATGLGARAAGLVAENAVGALASNSGTNSSPQDLATDLAAGAATSGAVRGLTAGAGAVYRGLRGTPGAGGAELSRFAEQNDVPLMTSDVVQPGSFVGKSAQAAGEKIPLTGTGSPRRAQQEARSALVQQYSERFSAPAPEEIVQSLQRTNSRVKNAAGQRLQQINSAMEPAGPITPTNAIATIDSEINRLSRLGGAADRQTISKLEAYRTELAGGADYGLLRDLRTQFRQDVKGERVVWPSQSQASVNRVYSSLTNDLDSAVKDNLGEETARRYRQANAAYANEAQTINNTRLKTILQKGDLTPEVANNLLFSNKPSEVRQLYSSLDQRGRNAARAAVIGKAYEKAGGSPDKFLNEINRMSSQTGILFKGADRQYLNGLTNYLEATRRASTAGVLNANGQELFQLAAPAAVAGDVIGTGGAGTAAALSYGALTRLYESKPVRNAIIRLSGTPAGSTQFEQQLQRVNDISLPVLQGARENASQ
ncbi:lytic transglycosylase domain-containing protein [Erwinia sp. P6884]|uniref:lytic transglycosylase domain-containing protein n=1 Tax=Erwinia sp. P6884 TaxID=3141450 RepID=UPI0031847C30